MENDERETNSEAAVAFKLFQTIEKRDPESVDAKDKIIAVYKDCLAAVRHRPSGWGTFDVPASSDDLDVPF